MSIPFVKQSEWTNFVGLIDNQQQYHMTDNIRKASDQGQRYRTPQAKIIEVKVQHVLCGSLDNEPMGERDISDAFHQD